MNKDFLDAQIEEMQKHAWIESEKVGHDIGESARRDWVKRFAKKFREAWNLSHNNEEK